MAIQRPNSFSARQIIGMITIYFGISQFFGVFIMVVYTGLQYLAGNILFPTDTSIQKFVLFSLFSCGVGAGFILTVVGIWLLRDKKGKYSKYLRN